MKELKHVKLYEAFESEKLTKTLGFINKESKNSVISILRAICNILDYPYSELSDDLFEYLPFNAALKKDIKHEMPEPLKCDYESSWISGEFCQEGRVKRTWGSGTRMTDCPKCNGKGLLYPRVTYDHKLIKMWFSKEGQYILSTITDGSEQNDPWRMNKKINISHRSITTTYVVEKHELRDANFAIILDFKKLKSKEYKKLSTKRSERSDIKSDSILTRGSNQDIRNVNIKRYIDKMSSQYTIDKGYQNISKVISTGLSTMPLNFISKGLNFSNIESLITKLYYCIENNREIPNESIKNIYSFKNSKLENINRAIRDGKEKYKKNIEGSDIVKKRFELWEIWEKLNEKLNNKLKEYKCDTIADIELLWSKIFTINRMFNNSDRYNLYKMTSVINYIYDSTRYDIYTEMRDYISSEEDIEKVKKDFNTLEKIIDKI